MQKPYIVMIILEAKPGKENELKQALLAVIEPHRKERACLEYRLHQDIELTKFIIYAVWASEAEHEKEFKKPYISALLEKLPALLERPFQAFELEEL